MFLKHKIYGLIFNIFRIFPLKSNKVSFLTNKNHSFESNFHYIAKELDERNEMKTNEKSFEYHYVVKDDISFKNMYNLATSKYVFLADNFFPMAFMNFHKNAVLVQLWHACGIFKKFGHDFVSEDYQKLLTKIGNRVNYLLISSKNIAEIYSHAFAMDKSKTLPFGIPKLDYYFLEENRSDKAQEDLRKKFEKIHPEIKDKKIVLYAPTFRETSKFNNVFNYFDLNRFVEELGEDNILFVRLHPRMHQFSGTDFENILNNNPNVINVGDYKNEQELLLVSDILISDYSSLMAEFALLNKPIVFFAYDLDDYMNKERGFYIDFEKDLPGDVVFDMDKLISIFKQGNFDMSRYQRFLDSQYDYFDDKSTERLVNFIFNE